MWLWSGCGEISPYTSCVLAWFVWRPPGSGLGVGVAMCRPPGSGLCHMAMWSGCVMGVDHVSCGTASWFRSGCVASGYVANLPPEFQAISYGKNLPWFICHVSGSGSCGSYLGWSCVSRLVGDSPAVRSVSYDLCHEVAFRLRPVSCGSYVDEHLGSGPCHEVMWQTPCVLGDLL